MRPELWQCSGKLAVLRRAFYGSNAGKQRVQNTSKPSSSLRLLGPLRAPSFVRNRSWNTHVYRKTRKIAVERGGVTHFLHSPLCRRPTHWWGRTYEEDGDAVREDEVGGNLAVKLGQR